jgi:hypothetical protein
MKFGIFCLTIYLFLGTQSAHATEFELYFLGGQSNMEGFGQVSELPDELSRKLEGVYIFHSPAKPDSVPATGEGKWTVFRPGHGTGFRFADDENVYSSRFGLEVSLLHALKAKLSDSDPNRKIAVIKYARNGSSIAIEAARQFGCWDPDFENGTGEYADVNQYDHFLATVRQALQDRDIDNDGETDRLIPAGIAWMQGESDAAMDAEIANAYQANLKRLIDLFRAALRTDDLPVVIGRISDSGRSNQGKVWPHGETVRDAQQRFVEDDTAAALVISTDRYDYSDPWHYDSEGYVDLGRQFAKAFAALHGNDDESLNR